MLELANESPFAAGLYPGWDRQRRHQLTLVVKAAWRFTPDGTLEPLDASPLVETDAHYGKPHESSLKAADETVPFKEGSEVYLYGTAHPPGEGATHTRVSLAIDFPAGHRFRKELLVFGARRWRRRMLAWVASEPEPLSPTPLRYENAFGGRHPGNPDSEYPLNPVGLGYNPSDWKVVNAELPRIEYANRLMAKPSHKPLPAGFGPLPVFWQPRADEIGEAVEEPERHGGCPWHEAAEPTLHNAAPPDQRFPAPFTGGETIRLAGFFPDRAPSQEIAFTLPVPGVRLHTHIDGVPGELSPVFDTLVIDTDACTVQLVGRAGIPWQRLDARQGWAIVKPVMPANRQPENPSLEGVA